MKKYIIPVVFILAACSQAPDKNNQESASEKSETVKSAVCNYSITADSAEVFWEAYKLTSKVAVGGTFDSFEFKPNSLSANNLEEILLGSSISINTNSVNSNHTERDPKIMKHFFGQMELGDNISGKITSVDGDNTLGSATANLTMNKVSRDVVFDYTVEDGEIRLESDIDVLNWKANKALATLNKMCEALHTGPDGKSKLWPDVNVSFYVPVSSDCD